MVFVRSFPVDLVLALVTDTGDTLAAVFFISVATQPGANHSDRSKGRQLSSAGQSVKIH
jgi:hypothetical protein